MIERDDAEPATHASPPCFLHEVDPAYSGLPALPNPLSWADLMGWRQAERARLIAARLAMADDLRRCKDSGIQRHLETAVGDVAGRIVSAYWPVRGEPDPRPVLQVLAGRGARTALPVVVAPGEPLVFRTWAPGQPLMPGVWGIPAPLADVPRVVPDVVIVPVVGFDRAGHRLGYGGGYFDRTLGAMQHGPYVVGVAYSEAAIPTIYPQPHDVPMNVVVTEQDVFRRTG